MSGRFVLASVALVAALGIGGAFAAGTSGGGGSSSGGTPSDPIVPADGTQNVTGGLTTSGGIAGTTITASGAIDGATTLAVGTADAFTVTAAGLATSTMVSTGTPFAYNFMATSNLPGWAFTESDAAVNNKRWVTAAASQVLYHQVLDDSSNGSSYMTIARSGGTAGVVTFPAAAGVAVSAGPLVGPQATTGTPTTWRVPTAIAATTITLPTCSTSADAGKMVYVDDSDDAAAAMLCVCRAGSDNTTYALVSVVDLATACIDP